MWGMVDGEEVEGIGFLVGIVETFYYFLGTPERLM